MDTEWAIAELQKFVAMFPSKTNTGQLRAGWPEHAMQAQAQVVEQILDRTLPDWRMLGSEYGRGRWGKHSTAAHRAVAQLKRAQELKDKIGDAAPQLDASRLHPWVWEPAKLLWGNGHYREAVQAAAVKVNAETQSKVSRRDVSEVKLFQESLSVDPPVAGRPRLRLMENDSSDLYTNRHVGAMTFAQGCYMAVRNPGAHEVLDELHEQEALEQLAAFSMLARWIDEATVATVEEQAAAAARSANEAQSI